MITGPEPSWITQFTGPSLRQSGKLVIALRHEAADAIHKEVVDPWRGAGLYPQGAEPTSEAEKVEREA
ncbi:hypothetical protein [Streptomyces sp. NPDC048142]|uniref:hypothetical protein n=1 Tax=Streptomyces sp. NPDC048142 TaxID=3365501 RepID=UPI00371AC1E3